MSLLISEAMWPKEQLKGLKAALLRPEGVWHTGEAWEYMATFHTKTWTEDRPTLTFQARRGYDTG